MQPRIQRIFGWLVLSLTLVAAAVAVAPPTAPVTDGQAAPYMIANEDPTPTPTPQQGQCHDPTCG